MTQINQYAKERLSGDFKDDDLMDFDSTEDNSVTFESAKGKLIQFVNYLRTKISTLYSADGSLSSNREVSTSGNTISFTGTGNFNIGTNSIVDRKLQVVGDNDVVGYFLNNSGAAGKNALFSLHSGTDTGVSSSFVGQVSGVGGALAEGRAVTAISNLNEGINIGLLAVAENGTNNHAIIVPENSGNIGFGTDNPTSSKKLFTQGFGLTAGTSSFYARNSDNSRFLDFKDDGQLSMVGLLKQNGTGSNNFAADLRVGTFTQVVDPIAGGDIQASNNTGVGSVAAGRNGSAWLAMWTTAGAANFGTISDNDITIYTNNGVRGYFRTNLQFAWGFSTDASLTSERVELAGATAFRETSTVTGTAGTAKIYAKDVGGTSKFFAMDGNGVETQLTP